MFFVKLGNFFIISPNNCWEYTKIRSANRLLCLRNSLQINAIGNIIITVNCERHSFGQWQRYPSVPYHKVSKQLIPILEKHNENGRCRIHRFARGTLVCEQIPEYCIINLDKVEVSRQPSMDGQRDER